MFIKLIENNGKQFIFREGVLIAVLTLFCTSPEHWIPLSRPLFISVKTTQWQPYFGGAKGEINLWKHKFASFSTGTTLIIVSINIRHKASTNRKQYLGLRRRHHHRLTVKWNTCVCQNWFEKCHAAKWCPNIYTSDLVCIPGERSYYSHRCKS